MEFESYIKTTKFKLTKSETNRRMTFLTRNFLNVFQLGFSIPFT